MKSKISDKDILQLFTSLKIAENSYPQDMIKSRRDIFTKQAAAMAILAKASGNETASTGIGQGASAASSSAMTIGGMSIGPLLETVLVIAIVAEAGVAAYAYREKIAEFFNSTFGPKVEQVVSPPDNSSSDIIANDENTAELPDGTSASTVTVTETPTPPGFINSESENNNSNGDAQVASTPAPTNDSNGLHLGQTKQPTDEQKKNESNDLKDNGQDLKK